MADDVFKTALQSTVLLLRLSGGTVYIYNGTMKIRHWLGELMYIDGGKVADDNISVKMGTRKRHTLKYVLIRVFVIYRDSYYNCET